MTEPAWGDGVLRRFPTPAMLRRLHGGLPAIGCLCFPAAPAGVNGVIFATRCAAVVPTFRLPDDCRFLKKTVVNSRNFTHNFVRTRTSPMQNSKKIVELEALRGLAAIVVLVHHFMLGFTPRLHGLLYPNEPLSIFGTPAFAFVNGSAAVVIFFSGLVLTVGSFQAPNLLRSVVAALKRWPRLAATVIICNVLAGAFGALNLFDN